MTEKEDGICPFRPPITNVGNDGGESDGGAARQSCPVANSNGVDYDAAAMRKTPRTSSKTGSSRRHGLFITFEGIEGSGKSTQAHALARALRAKGLWVIETREPGGTPVAERIREVFLTPGRARRATDPLTPECEVALILAARSQHVARLLPALRQGAVVVCDRFSDSTLAYQGFGRGVPLPGLRRLVRWATRGLTPDVTFFFDLPVAQGLRRRLRAKDTDRMDREPPAFHQRVRKGFLTLARRHARRIHTINAEQPARVISRRLLTLLDPVLTEERRARRRIIKRV